MVGVLIGLLVQPRVTLLTVNLSIILLTDSVVQYIGVVLKVLYFIPTLPIIQL